MQELALPIVTAWGTICAMQELVPFPITTSYTYKSYWAICAMQELATPNVTKAQVQKLKS